MVVNKASNVGQSTPLGPRKTHKALHSGPPPLEYADHLKKEKQEQLGQSQLPEDGATEKNPAITG